MANADMNRLMDNARIRLPGALDGVIQMELFAVLNEFFQNSNICTEEINIEVTPTKLSYHEDPDAITYNVTPTDGTIVRLDSVTDARGTPVRAGMPQPGTIVLGYSPNQAETYTATVVKTVTDPTTRDDYPEFPEWILNKYMAVILDGLLGRMLSQVAKPYSSVQMAQYHMRRFTDGTSFAGVEADRQNVYRAQNWRFPRGFSRRRIR